MPLPRDGHSMKLCRRQFLHLVAGFAGLPALSRTAVRVQRYPTPPVRGLIGLPAGLQPDIVARLVAQGLSVRLHQPVFIENKPGAGGNIATELVATRAPGGDFAPLTH